jgi:hypothetical protein
MRIKELSKQEGIMLKGIAILLVIMHNYCHEFSFAVEANEFTWIKDNITLFNQQLLSLDNNLIVHAFSFGGHYGVVLFLFVSGYGLVRKYESSNGNELKSIVFIWNHYCKLFKLMIIGFFANMVVNKLCIGYFLHDFWTIPGQLSFLINIIPSAHINPGPYWYLGMILQLYILYRLFIYNRNSMYVILLTLICILLQLICNPNGDVIYWLRRNFIGNLLPFALGILYARYYSRLSNINISITITFLISILIYVSNFFFILWILSPIFVIPVTIYIIKIISKCTFLTSGLTNVGKISAYIFITHSIVHWILLPSDDKHPHIYLYLILYLILCISMGYLYSLLLKKLKF